MHRSVVSRVASLAGPSVLAAATAIVVGASAATAQLAPGSTLTFTGTADATDIGLGGVLLDFDGPVVAAATGNTGAFASLNDPRRGGTRGTIADLRVGNGVQVIPSFLQFGGFKFTLLGLPTGRYGQAACYTETFAVGQTCTPYQSIQGKPWINVGLSPFSVANVSENPDGSLNSTASFDLFGTVTGPGGATSFFTGTIAAAFAGLPYQVALYTLEQQGLQGLTFTGTFTTTSLLAGLRTGASAGTAGDTLVDDASPLPAIGVDPTVAPEPATTVLLSVGLLATVGGVRRRRRATTR